MDIYNNISINIKDFFSPMLMQKLELENSKSKDKAKVNDWRETADSIAIDVDYNGKLVKAGGTGEDKVNAQALGTGVANDIINILMVRFVL